MKFEGTFGLPSLEFDEDKGMIKIWGKSIAVEAKEDFWLPLIEKLDSYLDDPRDIVITIDLEFFSTSSSKAMLEMFKLVEEKTQEKERKFLVEWIYDDEELLEAGEDYQTMVPKADFKFVEK
jgi:hypothetical protein